MALSHILHGDLPYGSDLTAIDTLGCGKFTAPLLRTYTYVYNLRMRILISILGLFFVLATANAADLSQCAAKIGSCAYYQCLSQKLACKPGEYPLGFGEKYCSAFVQEQHQYSTSGVHFLNKVRDCLEREMQASPQLTCERTELLAPYHHIKCYESSGFCDLSLQDKFLISQKVIGKVLQDPAFQNTVIQINLYCAFHGVSGFEF